MRLLIKGNKWLAAPVVGVDGREFILTTDASQFAIKVALQQRQENGSLAPIGFFSKTLRGYQKNYEITVKEALAVVECLHHFRPIIFGQKLELITDHSALVNVLNRNSVSTDMLERWRAIVNVYAPWSVRFISGKENVIGDWASRHVASEFRRWGEAEDDLVEHVFGIKESQELAGVTESHGGAEWKWFFQVAEEGSAEDSIRRSQLEDPELAEVMLAHQGGRVSHKGRLGLLKHSIMQRGQLWKLVDGAPKLWLPRSMVNLVIEQIHCSLGHAGVVTTMKNFRSKFYATGADELVQDYIRKYDSCSRLKSIKYTNKGVHTGPVGEDAPHSGHTWIFDMKGPLTITRKRNTMLITFVDPITRWPEMFATTNGNANTIMQCLLRIISRHGIPRRIIHDQGSNFMSHTME
jgi:hypothetical protein